MSPLSDTDLVVAARSGDRAAFAALVERYQSLVCGVAYASLGDVAASEDVGQTTFVEAWQSLEAIREPEAIRGWLARIARNRAIDAARQRQREERRRGEDSGDEPSPAPSPEELAAAREASRLVWAAIAHLPRDYREPLVLFYREGQSIAEVARLLDMSEDAVKKRISRGREQLATRLTAVAEAALGRNRPDRRFTAAVLAALPAPGLPPAAPPATSGASGPLPALALAILRRAAGTMARSGPDRWVVGVLALTIVAAIAAALVVTLRIGDRPGTRPGRSRAAVAYGQPVPVAQDSTGSHDMWTADAMSGEGGLLLEGRVVDASGQPVPGAAIGVDARPPRTTTADADGWFQFADLPARTYRIAAHHGALFCGPVGMALMPESPPLLLPLQSGAAVRLHVIDATSGAPLVGAAVRTGEPRGGIPFHSALTATDGTATLAGLSTTWHPIDVSAAGFGPVRISVTIASPTEQHEREVALWPGVSVSGRVLDAAEAPVAGAVIDALESSRFVPLELAQATADADGRWTSPALAPGIYRFRVTAAGRIAFSPPQVVSAQRTEELVLHLAAGRELSGRVSFAGGEPAAGALVIVGRSDDGLSAFSAETRTDSDGTFALFGLPCARLALRAVHEAALSVAVSTPAGCGDAAGLQLELSATVSIDGMVVSRAGDPVPNAQVTGWPEGYRLNSTGWDPLPLPQALADETGRFMLSQLPPGRYVLEASYPGADSTPPAAAPVTLAAAGARDVRVVVGGFGTLRGVVARGGEPVQQIFISFGDSRGSEMRNTNGLFVVEHLVPGKHPVVLLGPDFAPRVIPEVEITEGGTTDLGVIAVEPCRSISGRVMRDGVPVAGALVVSGMGLQGGEAGFRSEDYMMSPRTDADGRFTVRGEGPQSLVVIADHPVLGRSQAALVAKGNEPVELELHLLETGLLRGAVQYGGEATGAMIVAHSLGASEIRGLGVGRVNFVAYSPADSGFALRLAPGRYLVTASPNRGDYRQAQTTVSREVTIRSRETTSVEIGIARGCELVVQIVDRDGAAATTPRELELHLLPATIRPTTAAALWQELNRLPAGAAREWSGRGRETEFQDVAPGDYSLCGVQKYMGEPSASTWPVTCTAVRVPEGAAREQTSIRIE